MMIKMIVKTAWFKIKNLWPPSHQTMNRICRAEMHNEWLSVHVWKQEPPKYVSTFIWFCSGVQDYLLGKRDCPCLPTAIWYFWREGRLPRGWLKRVIEHRARIQKLNSQNSRKYLFPWQCSHQQNQDLGFLEGWTVMFLKGANHSGFKEFPSSLYNATWL